MVALSTSFSMLSSLIILSVTSGVWAAVTPSARASGAQQACLELQQQVPNIVSMPGSDDFIADMAHYIPTSTQNSTCGVAPTTIEEVQTIIKIVGRDDIRSPFAIESGGHTYNPGFSSTPGVQISMRNFRDLDYDASAQTVKIGSGWVFSDVYEQLVPYDVTVLGARGEGVGMGFLYGGGYSWYSNQYGLAIDNTIAYDLVLPNGTYVEVTQDAQPDLFFALRGGLNNYGIITSATMKTVPSSGVFAGSVVYSFDHNDEILAALENFSLNNEDLKAQMMAGFVMLPDQNIWEFFFFYDAPDSSPAPLQPFLSIPSLSSTMAITTHAQFVKDSTLPPGTGSFQDMIPVLDYTVPMMKNVQAAMNTTFQQIVQDGRSLANMFWFAEPFRGHFDHATFPSAYPHQASNPITPSSVGVSYNDASDLEYFEDKLKQASHDIQAAVVDAGQGQWDDVKYSNYAIIGTPVEALFGETLERMREIKATIDTKNVLSLLGGGFLV